MICQIYSATSPTEALAIVDAGADFVGVFPVDDYRGLFPGDPTIGSHVPSPMAIAIMEAIGQRAVKVVLSLSDDAREILETARRFRPDVLQVSGPQFRADRSFRLELQRQAPNTRLMHVVPVSDGGRVAESIAEAVRLQDVADYLILDTAGSRSIGASGRTHDWGVSKKIVELSRIPVILAGGLDPDNVAEAATFVRPWGVDSFTRTNRYLSDGTYVKDIDKVRAFCRAAKAAEEHAQLQK